MHSIPHAATSWPKTPAPLLGIIAAALLLIANTAPAQCVGDCGADGEVTINELILGVNIALGSTPLDSCPVFDADASGDVTVNELISAVNNALNGCSLTATPTPMSHETPAPTATPPASCGDGVVDFNHGETCDDGNRLDGDSCPANCRIASCTASGNTLDVDVSFTPPSGVDIAGVTILLRYPDGIVRIPGSANDQPVYDRVTNLPETAFTTLNDLDYALRAVILSTDQSPFAPGPLFSVEFDGCQGGGVPTADSFACTVEDAADTNATTVSGVTCSVALH